MTIQEKFSINRFHQSLIATHGIQSHHAAGWVSTHNQEIRQNALLKIADLNDCSVLDIGCGKGEFREKLSNIYPTARYIGIDINETLLDYAITNYGNIQETVFLKGDFSEAHLPATDYIIACGALSYYSEEDNYLYKLIEKFYLKAAMGFGFNLMSAVNDLSGLLKAYNPVQVLQFCESLSNKTVILDKYLENDFTIFMYH